MTYHELPVEIEVAESCIPLYSQNKKKAHINHEKYNQNDVKAILLCVKFESLLMMKNCSYVEQRHQ